MLPHPQSSPEGAGQAETGLPRQARVLSVTVPLGVPIFQSIDPPAVEGAATRGVHSSFAGPHRAGGALPSSASLPRSSNSSPRGAVPTSVRTCRPRWQRRPLAPDGTHAHSPCRRGLVLLTPRGLWPFRRSLSPLPAQRRGLQTTARSSPRASSLVSCGGPPSGPLPRRCAVRTPGPRRPVSLGGPVASSLEPWEPTSAGARLPLHSLAPASGLGAPRALVPAGARLDGPTGPRRRPRYEFGFLDTGARPCAWKDLRYVRPFHVNRAKHNLRDLAS